MVMMIIIIIIIMIIVYNVKHDKTTIKNNFLLWNFSGMFCINS